ncbi:putative uncharacterized protein DDB_G0271606 [Homarus americanus]|uniref:putative uncharacterized protein DDB_G0271606 n=1 Tax=Homarus americanus TaxID=6706 RepID=UPI001C46149E|nr:putative uncharacterized protein DDB_G0271606 [Homarus americanus]
MLNVSISANFDTEVTEEKYLLFSVKRQSSNTQEQQRHSSDTQEQQRQSSNTQEQQRQSSNTQEQQRQSSNTQEQQRHSSDTQEQQRQSSNTQERQAEQREQQHQGIAEIEQQHPGTAEAPQKHLGTTEAEQHLETAEEVTDSSEIPQWLSQEKVEIASKQRSSCIMHLGFDSLWLCFCDESFDGIPFGTGNLAVCCWLVYQHQADMLTELQ